jgi:UDP-3-O-acyl-N-acetylglucosamine deacetylase
MSRKKPVIEIKAIPMKEWPTEHRIAAVANNKQVSGTHYQVQKIQTWDFVSQNEIPYLDGNAIKYVARHREKGGKKDLEKAIHYIEKMIEFYYGDT